MDYFSNAEFLPYRFVSTGNLSNKEMEIYTFLYLINILSFNYKYYSKHEYVAVKVTADEQRKLPLL